MKVRKYLLTLAATLGCLSMSAQQAGEATEYVFQPHWYGQLQVGGQETLGETSFGKLLTLNAQVGAGYQFTPLFGARLSVNGWTSKASMSFVDKDYNWKWNYAAPMVDVTFDLSNLIGGYNPTRLVDVNLFAGVGANIGFKNDEAIDVNKTIATEQFKVLRNLWDGTKVRFAARAGFAVDFRLSNKVKLGVELQANTLSDAYNSKRAGNADWYFNGYVGVKYTFGKSHTTRVVPAPVPVIVYQDRIVEKIVETPVEKVAPAPVECPAEPLIRNVFFKISSTVIDDFEMTKLQQIADYLNAHPKAKVTITGFADKGTGSVAINMRLSKQRADVVADTLIKKFGIPADRIIAASMTDVDQQPFAKPELNRVAICVAE